MRTPIKVIDLLKITKGEVRNLSGHPRGVAAREFFELDNLDEAGEIVEVCFPDNLLSVAPSFVQGMFAESYRNLGSEVAFRNHFRWLASELILQQLERGIQQILAHEIPDD